MVIGSMPQTAHRASAGQGRWLALRSAEPAAGCQATLCPSEQPPGRPGPGAPARRPRWGPRRWRRASNDPREDSQPGRRSMTSPLSQAGRARLADAPHTTAADCWARFPSWPPRSGSVRRCRPAAAASPASCAAAQGGGGRVGGARPLADRKYVIRSHANEIPSFRIWHRGYGSEPLMAPRGLSKVIDLVSGRGPRSW
jgi:hypothetical protein